jgi:hypothetical protein
MPYFTQSVKKTEESASDCNVSMHHPLSTHYWNWAERLNLTHVLTRLQFSSLANVETAQSGAACYKQANNKLECKITFQCW